MCIIGMCIEYEYTYIYIYYRHTYSIDEAWYEYEVTPGLSSNASLHVYPNDSIFVVCLEPLAVANNVRFL